MKKLISPIIVYLILISAFGGLTFKANAKHTEKTEKIFYTTSQGVRIASLNILPQADLGFQDSAVCRIVFNYSLPYEELDVPNSSTKAIEVDNLIEDQREQARKFFLEKNIQIIQKYNLPSDTYINEYAPSVSFSLENDFDGYSELLENLNNDENVQAIYINEGIPFTPATISENQALTIDKAYKDRHFSNGLTGGGSALNGNDIKIGVLEAGGLVDTTRPIMQGTSIVKNETPNAPIDSDHATKVAGIISGTEGLARGATIYSAQLKTVPFESAINWLISKNVNVINCSFTQDESYWYEESDFGYYDEISAYLDYIVKIYKITIVACIGNEGLYNDGLCGNTGLGYNVLGVGSVDVNMLPSSFSSYKARFNISKPNLVAVGDGLKFNGYNYNSLDRGTSYSAPMVTGGVAVLMQKYPTLKNHPEMVMSLMTASSSSIRYSGVEYDDTGLENKTGAGSMNLEDASQSYGWTASFSVPGNQQYTSPVFKKVFNLSQYTNVKIGFASLINNANISLNPTYTNYGLLIYRTLASAPYLSLIDSVYAGYNNVLMYESLLGSGSYEVYVFITNKVGTYVDECSLTFRL